MLSHGLMVRFLGVATALVVCLSLGPGFTPSNWAKAEDVREVGGAKLDLSGGVSVQRARIDWFIEDTASMELDELIESLDESEHLGYQLTQFATISHGSFNPPVRMLGVLADRRVAKIYEILSEQDEALASRTAASVFDEKLKTYADQLAKCRSGKTDCQHVLTRAPEHAVSAALFLCARFCSRELFMDKLESWYATFPGAKRDLASMVSGGLPDALLELNLLLYVMHRNGASVDDLNERLKDASRKPGTPSFPPRIVQEYPPIQLGLLPFSRSDAHTNATDFTHVTRGVPADKQAILAEVPGFDNWPSTPFFVDADEQARVLKIVRSWVEDMQ